MPISYCLVVSLLILCSCSFTILISLSGIICIVYAFVTRILSCLILNSCNRNEIVVPGDGLVGDDVAALKTGSRHRQINLLSDTQRRPEKLFLEPTRRDATLTDFR